MSIRPPRAARQKRNTSQVREVATVSVVTFVVVVFALRALLAVLGVHTWTVTWRVVEVPTAIVIVPLHQWARMERSIAGNLTIAEFLAVIVSGAVAVIVLSSLANRRR